MDVAQRHWNELLEKLRSRGIPSQEIGRAIVKLGKPFDRQRILSAKDVIASYLNHEDNWVRREAMWFLTSWGRLVEYQPALIHALRNDPFLDNRSYAATCLGALQRGTQNPEAVRALRDTVEDTEEDELVRKYAYRSLLEIVWGDSAPSFSPHDQDLSSIDWDWVRSIQPDC
jgi:HEAT repeat protein